MKYLLPGLFHLRSHFLSLTDLCLLKDSVERRLVKSANLQCLIQLGNIHPQKLQIIQGTEILKKES